MYREVSIVLRQIDLVTAAADGDLQFGLGAGGGVLPGKRQGCQQAAARSTVDAGPVQELRPGSPALRRRYGFPLRQATSGLRIHVAWSVMVRSIRTDVTLELICCNDVACG